MRYFLDLSFNGTAYHGWQVQPNASTVQSVVQKALSTLLRSSIEIIGAGRTDAGVHARQMMAHFDAPALLENFPQKLNSILPKDIRVNSIFPVSHDAHARFDALSRTYHYYICFQKPIYNKDFVYYLKKPLLVPLMNKASKALLQHQDFKCFSKSNTDVKTYLCDIMKAQWEQEGSVLKFEIQANRFLRNMVRAIVGTFIEVGQEKIDLADFKQILYSRERSKAGYSVPAQGLFLEKIVYPKSLYVT